MIKWPPEWWILRKFKYWALAYGDLVSYSYLGPGSILHKGRWIEFEEVEVIYHRWRERYEALGYAPIDPEEWIRVGGGYRGWDYMEDNFWRKPNVAEQEED